jgi:hypothetical protein
MSAGNDEPWYSIGGLGKAAWFKKQKCPLQTLP